MVTRGSAVGELAEQLRAADVDLTSHWTDVDRWFGTWAQGHGLRADLRAHLLALPTDQANAIIRRSRETRTHFAWCLRDQPDEPFTFWLHEYKEQRDWRAGYADSVHNHRYHFCTTILRGGYQHERYSAQLSPQSQLITTTELLTSTPCPVGASDSLLASDFHRIPRAVDGTMTFLVKSREVTPWSLSYDPLTQESQRHVPVESRLSQLVSRL
ncbi:hypothetical protein [Actinophytocola oryzae]|uniref:Uncharacterized protein n=1 Tax=Actinophytocola oryzae TaxID=502181 RepID=A0A4R7USS7_9PSEU|nr:hypothetical protein [Actinophytocola oryzae]TDV36041.1 hypothetical protein CLV71_13219 [Actinophytocola oryzae]